MIYCFVINGVKIFAMGVNYIPQDNLQSRISPERTRALLETAKDANFNCLRVWGGGYYPEDEFYDMCDEMGFVVWQDFMIARANVWLTRENKEEFVLEAVDNVRRIRHHASLGMFCGNNEMELYFDLTNKESYKVIAKTDFTAKELEKSLKIMSVYDIGR